MTDVGARLVEIVGAQHVLEGDAIGDDYTHDEALGLTPHRPAFVVRPSSTEDVAAVVNLAGESGLPVTARGSGTGLSGACVPAENGILVSFERMNHILEIDTDNHTAVVEPGVTLDELDKAAAQHGLVYPVFPGENSASLGGNVATNAGGMRAVKYGVTRHHVLGLTAVLGTGEVINTGGKLVKSSSGYDLTQLIIGSEGTLAVVTKATLKLHPRPAHAATLLAPFSTLEGVSSAVPKVVGSGIGPLIVEYIDLIAMGAILDNAGLDLGVPDDVRGTALAYLVVVLENRLADRLDEDTEELATLLSEVGAMDVYVLPPHSGTQLIEAREKAFWTAKALGANDIIDMVVPRAAIPEYMTAVADLAARDGLARRRLRACRRRQRAPLGVPARRRGALPPHQGHLLCGHRPRRGDLRRARHRHGEEAVSRRARGSRQARPHAPDQGGVRPRRNPQPRHHLRPGGIHVNGAQALIRTLVDAGVDTCFMNPGTSEMHFVAALDAVPEMHGVLALFEGVATGAADGYARMAGKPAAVLLHLGPGLGNGLANLHNARKAFTPVVNIVGDHATYHKQYDAQLESDIETVARNVSSFIRTSTKPGEVAADAAATVAAAIGPPGGVATLILPADVSWGEPAEPSGPVSTPARIGSRRGARGPDRRRPAERRARCTVRRWQGVSRRGARVGESRGRRHRRQDPV